MSRYSLWVRGARQVVQVASHGERGLTAAAMDRPAVLQAEGGDGVGLLVDSSGLLAAVGRDSALRPLVEELGAEETLDAAGCCLLPGFVDGHTHSVWVGDRVHEFKMKLTGASYMEVHAAGGGIHFTVERVRAASHNVLLEQLRVHAERLLQAGTTLAEVKSGYGLDADTEIKMLEVIEAASKDPDVHLEMSATYCGAHAIPKGLTSEEACEDVLERQLPRLAAAMESGALSAEHIDVFCEQGVFSVDQTRRILRAGKALGLQANFHGEELHRLHSAEMGAAEGARAISHLEEVSEAGVSAMAAAGTAAVLLPTTAYMLRLTPPPARAMVDAGVLVALGSDFNPNAHCLAMPVVLHLACVLLRLTMNEALVAATLNAAASLGRAHSHGSLEPGKVADVLVVEAPRWEHLIYQLGGHHHLIRDVIKRGRRVYSRKDTRKVTGGP